MALDYATAAVLPGFILQPPADSAEAILTTVCRHIDKLDPTEATAVKAELKKMLEADRQLFNVQREPALVCILRTISRITGPSPGQEADAFVRELIDTLEQLLIVWEAMSRPLEGPPPELNLDGVRSKSVEAAEDIYREIDLPNLQGHEEEGVEHAVLYASAWRLLTEVWYLNRTIPRCETTAEEVRRRAKQFGDPRLLMLEMRCYGEILSDHYEDNAKEAKLLEAAERMDEIWTKVGKGFEWSGLSSDLAHSTVWTKVSSLQLNKKNFEGAEGALNKVWQTMEGRKLTEKVARILAEATRNNIAIWDSRKNLEECRAQLSNLEKLAAPYESNFSIAYLLANGRATASHTFAVFQDAHMCESIARKVEAFVAQYPEDRRQHEQLGAVWLNFWGSMGTRLPSIKSLGEFTKDWIDPLHRIAAPSATKQCENDPAMQFHSAAALYYLIRLLNRVGSTQEAHRAAESALQICERFQADEEFGVGFEDINAKVLNWLQQFKAQKQTTPNNWEIQRYAPYYPSPNAARKPESIKTGLDNTQTP